MVGEDHLQAKRGTLPGDAFDRGVRAQGNRESFCWGHAFMLEALRPGAGGPSGTWRWLLPLPRLGTGWNHAG